MKRMLWLFVLITIGLLSVAGCDTNSPRNEGTNATPAGAATPTVHGEMEMDGTPTGGSMVEIRDDAQFIEMMVPHHQLAVDMAKLAQQKATRDELKGLANDIIMTQEDEVRRMESWLAEIEGGDASATAMPDHGGMEGDDVMSGMPGMDVDMEKLAASADFDRDFVRAMIPHHQSAIDMSRAALPNLKHPALRDLAQDIITTQQLEIDRMDAWLRTW